MWPWIVGFLLLGAFLFVYLPIRRIGKKYGAAFSGAHKLEFAQLLFRLRDEAVAADDPVFDSSSAGIGLAYSITEDEDGTFIHHISMSHREGYLARALGGRLFCYACQLLDPRILRIDAWIGETDVYHLVFDLHPDQNRELLARAVPVAGETEAEQTFQAAQAHLDGMLERLNKTPPPRLPDEP